LINLTRNQKDPKRQFELSPEFPIRWPIDTLDSLEFLSLFFVVELMYTGCT